TVYALDVRVYISFFFTDIAITEIFPLSLHDALPIYRNVVRKLAPAGMWHGEQVTLNLPRDDLMIESCKGCVALLQTSSVGPVIRSEEHTSELQSRFDLVCRLLLEKKKNNHIRHPITLPFNTVSMITTSSRHIKFSIYPSLFSSTFHTPLERPSPLAHSSLPPFAVL